MGSTGSDENEIEPSSTAPTLRDRHRDLTRTLIVDAAQQVFAERGYTQTRVEDIASAAGVTRATFYTHFRGKRELAKALILDTRDRVIELYESLDQVLAARSMDPRDALRQWLAEWLDGWRQNAALNLGLTQAAAVDPQIAEVQLEVSPDFIDALRNAPWNRGEKLDERARERALMLELMTQRLFSLLSVRSLTVSDEAALDFLADLWADVFGVDDWSHGAAS